MRVVLAAGLLAAATVFAIRAPLHGLSAGGDFILIYTPARAWLTGVNPYDLAVLDNVWADAGGPIGEQPSTRPDGAPLYPLTAMAILAPFAVLPWAFALPMWIAANLVFLAIVIWAIASLAGFRFEQKRFWVFLIVALMFMPVHTTFRHGQTPLLVVAMLLAGYALAHTKARRGTGTGVLVALAALLKPQIGLPFVVLEFLQRQWRSLAGALATVALVLLVAILPMSLRGVPWLASWRANLSAFTDGNVGDPSPLNPIRYQLINLHYPLHEIIDHRATVSIAVLAIAGALAALFFRTSIVDFAMWMRRRPPMQNSESQFQNPLLILSMVAVLALMVVYHRYYDAVLLLLPLAWAIGAIAQRRNVAMAWALIALMTPYFLHLGAVFFYVQQRAALPAWVVDGWWWNGLLMPLQAWALLGMAIVLIIADKRENTPNREPTARAFV